MFNFQVTQTTQTSGSTKSNVDWDALNAHVVEAAGTANKARSIPGVISGIIDLGEQERPDYEEEFKGDEDARRAAIAQDSAIYFKEEGGKVYKCRPMRPVQQVAITVDFPQITVDKGQFFGDSNPAPLRMLLNGEYILDGERVVGKAYSITEKKYDDGTWAFAKNNGLHKLADACEILDENGYFQKERIGELLGKVAQFTIRVWMKPSKKDPSRAFMQEEIKLAGIVPEGVPVPELDSSYLYGVNMTRENDLEHLKVLRVSVKNTQKRANNYAGSVLERQFAQLDNERSKSKPADAQSTPAKPAAQAAPAKAAKPKAKAAPAPADDAFDDDVPF